MGTFAPVLRGVPAAVVVALLLVAAPSAFALTGAPVQVGTTAEVASSSPVAAIAVDGSGTGYVAWIAPGPAANTNVIGYCMMSAGQSSCGQQGTVAESGNPPLTSVSLAIDGSTVVLLAQDFAGSSNKADNYVDEWTAQDGFDTFTAVDGGESVSQGSTVASHSAFLLPTAPGAPAALGYGFGEVLYGSEYFDVISPATAPSECSEASCTSPSVATFTQSGQNLPTQTDAQYASETGSNPGVLGVFDGPATACPSSDVNIGTSFIYGAGDQSATSSYAVSPGQAGSAWTANIANLECTDSSPSVSGGPSGLGVVETDNASKSIVYLPFNQATRAFGSAATVDPALAPNDFATYTSVSQDGGGGIYATYYDGNQVYPGPIKLAYSPDGGLLWDGPVALNNTTTPVDDAYSAVGSNGQGWLVWVQSGSGGTNTVWAQQFNKTDAPPPPTTITTSQSSGHEAGPSISILAGTTGETDTAAISGAHASVATGFMGYALYSAKTCASSSLVTPQGTPAVSKGVAPASQPIMVALNPGTYYWGAFYTGDALNGSSTSCSEVLTVKPAANASSTGTSKPGVLSFSITCAAGTPCAGTTTLTLVKGAVARDAAGVARAKVVKLGTVRFRIKPHRSKVVKLHLGKAARKAVARLHGRFTATAQFSEKVNGHHLSWVEQIRFRKGRK